MGQIALAVRNVVMSCVLVYVKTSKCVGVALSEQQGEYLDDSVEYSSTNEDHSNIVNSNCGQGTS